MEERYGELRKTTAIERIRTPRENNGEIHGITGNDVDRSRISCTKNHGSDEK